MTPRLRGLQAAISPKLCFGMAKFFSVQLLFFAGHTALQARQSKAARSAADAEKSCSTTAVKKAEQTEKHTVKSCSAGQSDGSTKLQLNRKKLFCGGSQIGKIEPA